MEIFVTSDHHFNHANIIKYVNRPFENSKEMDSHMIKKWNEIVKPNDIVVHLGDFALGLPTQQYKQLLSQLNGDILLVQGNHDRKGVRKLRRFGFLWVGKRLEVQNISFTHRPQSEQKDIINIHGHTHGQGNIGIDVSVEVSDYKPLKLKDVLNEHFSSAEEFFIDMRNNIYCNGGN